jgi:hypothetical protein
MAEVPEPGLFFLGGRASCLAHPVGFGRAMSADVPRGTPGTAGKMPALPGKEPELRGEPPRYHAASIQVTTPEE